MGRDVFQEIVNYNQRFVGRDPDLLPYKLRKMAQSPFGFLRGTFHLFAADWLSGLCAPWRDGSESERDPILGDVHIESFGAAQGADGRMAFELQDFDEVTEGDYDLDVFRAAASAALAADQSGLPLSAASAAATCLAQGYADEAERLAAGELPRDVGCDETSPQPIRDLCEKLRNTARRDFIAGLTEPSGDRLRLRRDERHRNLQPERARVLLQALGFHLKATGLGRGLLPADIAFRVSGTGGLGRFRFAVLLSPEGGDPLESIVLDLKEAVPAALDLYRNRTQVDQASQVARRMTGVQSSVNSWTGELRVGSQPYQVRELGPHDGHLSPAGFTDAEQAQAVLECCGRILAVAHHRSFIGSHQGSFQDGGAGLSPRSRPPAVRLRDRKGLWLRRTVSFGLFYAALAQEDHRAFTGRLEELLAKLSAR